MINDFKAEKLPAFNNLGTLLALNVFIGAHKDKLKRSAVADDEYCTPGHITRTIACIIDKYMAAGDRRLRAELRADADADADGGVEEVEVEVEEGDYDDSDEDIHEQPEDQPDFIRSTTKTTTSSGRKTKVCSKVGLHIPQYLKKPNGPLPEKCRMWESELAISSLDSRDQNHTPRSMHT